MHKIGQERHNIVEAVFALIIGFLLVISIPELKIYFDRLVGAIFTGIILGIVVAVIIFVVWFVMNREEQL